MSRRKAQLPSNINERIDNAEAAIGELYEIVRATELTDKQLFSLATHIYTLLIKVTETNAHPLPPSGAGRTESEEILAMVLNIMSKDAKDYKIERSVEELELLLDTAVTILAMTLAAQATSARLNPIDLVARLSKSFDK